MLKMEFFDRVHDGTAIFSRPLTPSYWISKNPEYRNIIRVSVIRGGIGGAAKTEYLCATLEDLENAGKFLRAADLNGREKMINTDYIIDAEPLKVAEAKLHSDNHNFTVGDYVIRYLLYTDATAKLVD